jgi:hypothetical protein
MLKTIQTPRCRLASQGLLSVEDDKSQVQINQQLQQMGAQILAPLAHFQERLEILSSRESIKFEKHTLQSNQSFRKPLLTQSNSFKNEPLNVKPYASSQMRGNPSSAPEAKKPPRRKQLPKIEASGISHKLMRLAPSGPAKTDRNILTCRHIDFKVDKSQITFSQTKESLRQALTEDMER